MYGNVINRIMEDSKPISPEVGMGATMTMYSDRYPYTVRKVNSTGKTIWISPDQAEVKEGTCWPDPDYNISTNWELTEKDFTKVTLRKDGRWKVAGGSQVIVLGTRQKYVDPSF
jgi:hypothetical protein